MARSRTKVTVRSERVGDPAAKHPRRPSWAAVRASAAACRACDLWARATQTVFGDGGTHATIVLVGEQPGDEEDHVGRPFVGPAGRLLDHVLAAAGIDRRTVYVTNVVKHFKWEPRGTRRIHKRPSTREIAACRQWLDAELVLLRPRVLVCLGATPAQALLGRWFRVTEHRGTPLPSPLAPVVMATVHPASVLRAEDAETRHRETEHLIEDMRTVARLAGGKG